MALGASRQVEGWLGDIMSRTLQLKNEFFAFSNVVPPLVVVGCSACDDRSVVCECEVPSMMVGAVGSMPNFCVLRSCWYPDDILLEGTSMTEVDGVQEAAGGTQGWSVDASLMGAMKRRVRCSNEEQVDVFCRGWGCVGGGRCDGGCCSFDEGRGRRELLV